MRTLWKKNKLNFWIVLYGIVYLSCFIWLEWNTKNYHVIETPIDRIIPFCEYFVIPYLLWFVFILMTKIYFASEKRPKEEYYRLLGILGTGMTTFLIVSFIFPNGHNLRPELSGSGIFISLTKVVHFFDTSANVLPSLHVFEAVACCTALLSNKEFRVKKGRSIAVVLLTISIVLSTMFLKQHSIVDVITGMLFYAVCHEIFYYILPATKHVWGRFIKRGEIFSIPNILSMVRILLAVLFLGIFNRYGMEQMGDVLMSILVISGITDFLDGRIARKYNMITEFGKLIDPVADKLTQFVVLWCLMGKYPLAKVLLAVFVIKESYMCIEGTKTVITEGKNEGAKWYGKVSTAVFYTVMVILVLFRNIPTKAANYLLFISGSCMIAALVMYAKEYKKKQEALGKEKEERYYA